MKRIYIYLSGFFVCIAVFSLVFYVSFKRLQSNVEKKQREQRVEDENNRLVDLQNQPPESSEPDEALEADTVQKAAISMDTEYLLEIYDSERDVVTEEVREVPSDFIGMEREELAAYLDAYMDNVSLDEYLEGLLSYEIMSFSSDKLVLRKTYRPDESVGKFFVVSVDGEVVVYYSDKKTVYDYTGIDVANLAEEEQMRLGVGFEVMNLEELYGILENYSS